MLTNNSNITVSLAVWLADDEYEHSTDPNEISATGILKPMREIILSLQNKDLDDSKDIESRIASKIGTALHSSIEAVWSDPARLKKALIALDLPDALRDKIVVNPDRDNIPEESIAVFVELRNSKKVNETTITGKFDQVIQGQLEDFKSSGTYGYIKGNNIKGYMEQGSIYRWLNPDIIKNDVMLIQMIFLDWNAQLAKQSKDYPASKLLTIPIRLMSIDETQRFLENKVNTIGKLRNSPQEDLPLCTELELWKDNDTFKYYKNPEKTSRSTKNFDSLKYANLRLVQDGSVGIVKTIPGTVKKCKYCSALNVCDQAMSLIKSGSLIM